MVSREIPIKKTHVHTSTATIAKVKTSAFSDGAPPFKTSGAAHVVMLTASESWKLRIEPSSRGIDVSPKSVRRAWPLLSIITFALSSLRLAPDAEKSGESRLKRLTPFRFPCIILHEWR